MFLLQQIDHTLKKIKGQAANVITLLNLSFGCLAIFAITQNQLHLGLLLIFVAALSDRFDGMAARKFKTESEFGKQLDSLSDVISFGVAPALLLYQGLLFMFGAPGTVFSIIYIACGAFRLAKFNITENNGYFTGLPITVAGVIQTLGFLAIPYLPPQFFMFLTITLAFLMVSPFKIKKV